MTRVLDSENLNAKTSNRLAASQRRDPTEGRAVVSLLSQISNEPVLWKGSLYAVLVQVHHIFAALFKKIPDGIEKLRRWENLSQASFLQKFYSRPRHLKEGEARDEDLVSFLHQGGNCSC